MQTLVNREAIAAGMLLAAIVLFPHTTLGAPPPTDVLLPASTQGYLVAPDFPAAAEKWDETQLGQLLDQPAMQAFLEDFQRQLREGRSGFQFGLTWEEIRELARGEVAAALVHEPPARPANVLLIDVTDNLARTEQVLNRLFVDLNRRPGATWSQPTIGGVKVTVFNLPEAGQEEARQAVYFVKQGMLGAADSLEVARVVLSRFDAGQPSGLAEVPEYRVVMARCAADAEATQAGEPQLRWFARPIEFAEARRLLDPSFLMSEKLDLLRVAKNSGFGGLEAVGGFTHLRTGPYDLIHRVAVFAPAPYEQSMRMLEFPNIGPFTPAPWMPADAETHMAFGWDMTQAAKYFGPLFDQTVGGGSEGTWEDTLESIRTDPKGPQIDLEKELFSFLGNRAATMSDTVRPITPQSQRQLFVAEVTDPQRVQAALDAYYRHDDIARKQSLRGYEYWEIEAEEREEPRERRSGSRRPPARRSQPLEPSALGVIDGQLLVASHVSLFKKVLEEREKETGLAATPPYQRVAAAIEAEMERRQWPKIAMQRFVRSEDSLEATYVLARQGKLRESDTLSAQILQAVFDLGPGRQQLSAAKLPDYDQVRPYLAPSGTLGISEPGDGFQGWFLVDFTLAEQGGPTAGLPRR